MIEPRRHQGNGTWLPLIRSRGLVASGRWLLRLRWLVGGAILLGTGVAKAVLPGHLPMAPLFLTGVAVLGYNLLFLGWVRRIEQITSETEDTRVWHARAQVGLDWLAMVVLLHYSGGLESPLLFFFVFHVAIATLLLGRPEALAFTLLAIALLVSLGASEAVGVLPHVHVAAFIPGEAASQAMFVAGMLAALAVAGLAAYYLTAAVASGVRRSEDQLAALYLASQAVTSTLELPEVLARLMRETVEVMGASGASIGLLDATGTQIEPAASYGLSERYLAKGPLALLPGYISTDVMTSGEPTFIHTDEDRDRLQYPDVVKAEGINTILYVRLPGKTRPLGLMRAYSNRPHAFTHEDARFLATIAAQGAGAIENALSFQALRQLDAEKSKFVRLVTHELRSPVSGAQTMLKMMLEGYAGELNAKGLEFIKLVERRLTTLQLLIDDLLELAAGRSGLEVEEPRPLVVGEVLQQAVGQIEPQAVEKHQELTLTCGPCCQQLEVVATPTGMMRILTNLIGNAVKYTPKHGQVTITASRSDHQVAIEVRDTGIGIPEASLPKLFTEFFRAPNAKAVETGTGLGLVIAKDMVDRFGGTLSVRSLEGQGTTFTVCLPIIGA
jgi:signal transduction histidine kinase